MLDTWRFTGRSRRAGPSAAKAGLNRKLTGLWAIPWAILAIGLFWYGSASAEQLDYTLGTGDILRVTVFGQEDLSGEFEVDSAGRIALPLMGDLAVVNRSVTEVEDLIVKALKPDYLKNPQVSVEIINYRPFYIIGEVAQPGSYAYVGGMRVINAVAMAGGFTYRADEDGLLITRANGDGEQERVEQGAPVFPGDVIEVPERFF